MLTAMLSAVESRVSPQRGLIIDHNTIGYGLSNDGDIHASDQASVVIKKINVRPSETLWDKCYAFVGPQD